MSGCATFFRNRVREGRAIAFKLPTRAERHMNRFNVQGRVLELAFRLRRISDLDGTDAGAPKSSLSIIRSSKSTLGYAHIPRSSLNAIALSGRRPGGLCGATGLV